MAQWSCSAAISLAVNSVLYAGGWAPEQGRFRRLENLGVLGGHLERALTGGAAQRRRWFDAYIRTVTSRDVPGISRVQHVAELPKLLGALAAMTEQQLVVARLAEKVALRRALRPRGCSLFRRPGPALW